MKKKYDYADFFEKNFENSKVDEHEIKKFADHCPPGIILDIGAGTGRTLGFFNSHPHLLLESDPEMIKKLKNKCIKYQNAEVIQGHCPTIPMDDNSCAGIFATQSTVGEINPICVFLKEIKRTLKPNGKALLIVLNPEVFETTPIGIHYNASTENKDFSSFCNTLPVPNLGKGEYQTLVWLRGPERPTECFTVRQYFPNLNQWQILFKELGFEVLSNPDENAKQKLFTFIIRKPELQNELGFNPIVSFYNKIASEYDRFANSAEYGVPSWLTPFLKRYKNVHPTVLDLACGNGYIGRIFAEQKIKTSFIIGYDIADEMVLECEKNSSYSHVCRFNLANGLPGIKAMSIDVVTAFGLLEFIPDIDLILSDIHRTLALGGDLYCTFEATEGHDDFEVIHFGSGIEAIPHYRRSESNISNLLKKAGFAEFYIEKKLGYKSPKTGNEVYYFYVHAVRKKL